MPFIGNQPALSYTSFAVQHFTTSATTSYTLDHSVANENEIRLVINNVVQQPGSSYAYTASGTTLTLSAATSATDTMYAVFLGKAVQTVTPASGTVTNAMLGETITVANGGTGLTSGFKNGITEVDQWRLTASKNSITSSFVDITADLERVDEPAATYIGTGMSQSSGIFTFPVTGKWKVEQTARWFSSSDVDWCTVAIFVTQDNSSYNQATEVYTHMTSNHFGNQSSSIIIDVTDTSLVKVKFSAKAQASANINGHTDENHTFFTFTRLGDT